MTDTRTLINTIEVDPDRYEDVLELMSEGLEHTIRHRPGFLSGMLFGSVDHTRVISVVRWENAAAANATRSDPAASEIARRVAEIASPVPGLFELAGRYDPAPAG